jgi:hypothetical protein
MLHTIILHVKIISKINNSTKAKNTNPESIKHSIGSTGWEVNNVHSCQRVSESEICGKVGP